MLERVHYVGTTRDMSNRASSKERSAKSCPQVTSLLKCLHCAGSQSFALFTLKWLESLVSLVVASFTIPDF